MYEISRTCIEDFIQKHGFEMEKQFDNKTDRGMIKLLNPQFKGKNSEFARIEWLVDFHRKELHITSIKSKISDIPQFKFTKLILLLLLSDYLNSVDIFTLTAIPSNSVHKSEGKEFCLFCYYQQLGFKFVDNNWIKQYQSAISICKKQLPEKDTRSCMLCKCQKLDINIGEIKDLFRIYADMHAVALNIKKILQEYHNEIC